MDDREQTLLNHYNLPVLYPLEWPTGKGDSDDSDDDNVSGARGDPKLLARRSKPRHSALERLATQRRGGGAKIITNDNAAQLFPRQDAPDPLGASDSVVRILRHRGIPVDRDAKLRKGNLTHLLPPKIKGRHSMQKKADTGVCDGR
jgi:exocyst complex component 2